MKLGVTCLNLEPRGREQMELAVRDLIKGDLCFLFSNTEGSKLLNSD